MNRNAYGIWEDDVVAECIQRLLCVGRQDPEDAIGFDFRHGLVERGCLAQRRSNQLNCFWSSRVAHAGGQIQAVAEVPDHVAESGIGFVVAVVTDLLAPRITQEVIRQPERRQGPG